MGREAECTCNWNGTAAKAKALIEPPELILRGALKRRVPFAQMNQIRAEGEHLRFEVAGDSVSLNLGSALALKWVQLLTTPPPTLAKKQASPRKR